MASPGAPAGRSTGIVSCLHSGCLLPHLTTFLNLQQYHTEDCLIRSVRSAAGIDLRWEHRVVGVVQDGAGVLVDAQTPSGPVRLRGCYVLACDGARSSMRKLLGLDFSGTTFADRFLIADIRADLPLAPEPRFFFDHPTNPGSTILIHPQPDGVWRIDWQLGREVDIVAERSPDALGAPRSGAKAPDPALRLIEGPGVPRTLRLRRLLGPGFVGLYFAPDHAAARLFPEQASTVAARRHRIRADEVTRLVQLASANPDSAVSLHHVVSGVHSNWVRTPWRSAPTSLTTLTSRKP